MQRRILFGLKKLLVEWDFAKGSIYVNTDNFAISVEDRPVLKVDMHNYTLSLSWLDDKWEQWSDLQPDQQFKELIRSSEQTLAAARERKSKGKGKSSDGKPA